MIDLRQAALKKLADLGQEIEQAETPPEWPLVKNILDEYGLDAIAFVAEWKAAQRKPLTDEDFLEACQLAERGNYLLAFQRIQIKLKERNT